MVNSFFIINLIFFRSLHVDEIWNKPVPNNKANRCIYCEVELKGKNISKKTEHYRYSRSHMHRFCLQRAFSWGIEWRESSINVGSIEELLCNCNRGNIFSNLNAYFSGYPPRLPRHQLSGSSPHEGGYKFFRYQPHAGINEEQIFEW